MNILITGGAGFVGTNLTKRLLKDNHTVTVVDDYSTGKFNDNHLTNVTYKEQDVTEDIGFTEEPTTDIGTDNTTTDTTTVNQQEPEFDGVVAVHG